MSHGSADNGVTTPSSTFYDRGRFGRLFPTLPAFSADTPTIRAALIEIGQPGGIMDAADPPRSPIELITDPTLSEHNPNNPELTAGFTFLGQFLDHDMTFDPTSSLARRQDPESIRNFRIPALDLDSLYGGGPAVSPALYDQSVDHGQTTMLVEEIPGSAAATVDGQPRFDLPRNSQNVAVIGDPRNDENLIVSQLHLAMLRFHNAVVADVKATIAGLTLEEVFAEAQRIVRWHYQWMIVHQFLPKTVGSATMADIIANGRKFYDWRHDPYIPVEFSVAAYRFGHSQVRPSYRANFGTSATDVNQQFFAMIFDHALSGSPDPADLRGGCRGPRRYIDWQTFFDFGDGRVRPNKLIDTTLSSALFHLLGQPTGSPDSLAIRNLLRNLTMTVPSGQAVARAMKLPVLKPIELAELAPYHLDERTPLWFYVLREAQVEAAGRHLGSVGGRIVGEVIYGLIEGDNQSYLAQDPEWTPTYGVGDTFEMTHLLTKAGVVGSL